MPYINFTEFRQNMASHLDAVCESKAPLVVTRQKGQAVVVLSEEEFEGIQETLHLLKSPRNASRLMRSIEVLNGGKGVSGDLAE